MSQSKRSLFDIFKGFSKLSYFDRLDALTEANVLSEADQNYLKAGGLQDVGLAENFIENVIGYFQLPLGVATNFKIDDRDFVIPMAVEETSIIAAASKTAKWIRENGSIKTEIIGKNIIGQIQFAKIQDFVNFEKNILLQKNYLIELANSEVAFGLVKRGGGVNDLQLRKLDRGDGFFMAIIHIYMDPCDAMGANIMNQVCEFLKEPLQEFTGEKVTMCILSNLVDSKLTKATITLNKIDPELALKIEEASRFAELDPYRAATNNKGVLNGIDPILVATGNDWRAVEAGIHAFAARDGQYRSITKWRKEGDSLVGIFEAPLIVGTVGGVTTLHPSAQIAMKLLGVQSSNELSRIMAAVGLVQNLGALRALTTVGIIEGHMKLHIKNLSLGAGATEKEMPYVVKKLEEILALRKRISLSNAVEVLNDLRKQANL
ncbi:MAG: hydroxymethylglutaryl-CoA reductase, degradative [Bdellovibrio sp.]|nr:hydroxymethylglutaryl-CoA reductase, degradative [Bdellovibrio sp.]